MDQRIKSLEQELRLSWHRIVSNLGVLTVHNPHHHHFNPRTIASSLELAKCRDSWALTFPKYWLVTEALGCLVPWKFSTWFWGQGRGPRLSHQLQTSLPSSVIYRKTTSALKNQLLTSLPAWKYVGDPLSPSKII